MDKAHPDHGRSQQNATPAGSLWRIGDWRLDVTRDELTRDGDPQATRIRIEPRQTRLLLALAERAGEVISAEELLAAVWRDVVVTPDSVYQTVARLRRALRDDAESPRYIETLPRKGYRLLADVEALPLRRRIADVDADAGDDPRPVADAAPPPALAPDALRRLAARSGRAAAIAVAVVAAALIGALAWTEWSRPSPPAAGALIGIAVLPFADGSASGADEAFVQGMVEEITASLQHIAGVRVAASSSVTQLASAQSTPAEYADKLGVSYLLRGTVARGRERVRVNAALVDSRSSEQRWEIALEQPHARAMNLPDDVAARVATALGKRATAVPKSATTAEFAAYEAYLTARHEMRRGTPESIAKARDALRRAIDFDPKFSAAYSGLALAWMAEHDFSGLPLRDAVGRAQPLVDMALKLDAESAQAHAVQGYVLLQQMQLARAEPHLERALELNPNFAAAQMWHGMAAAFDGRPADAVTRYTRAGQLDPLNFLVHMLTGVQSINVAGYEAALKDFAAAEALAPEHPNPHWGRALVAFARGELDAAAAGYRRALALNPQRYELWQQLAWIELDRGDTIAAADAFKRASDIAPRLLHLRAEAIAVALRRAGPTTTGTAIDTLSASPQLSHHPRALLAHFEQMRGNPLRAARWARQAADAIDADPIQFHGPFSVFLGEFLLVDLAAALNSGNAAGDSDRAQRYLAVAADYLDRLQHQGNVMHGLHLQRARVHALRGERESAITALERAAALGSRRGWWLAHDPALKSLRGDARFDAAVKSMMLAAAPARTPTAKVLWVDDNPDNNARERAALEAIGVRITLAVSTQQALAAAQSARYDVIISDMGRPPDLQAGYTLLAQLRARNLLTPYIIYTKECTTEQRLDAQSRGAHACVDRISEVMNATIAVLEGRSEGRTEGRAAAAPAVPR